MFDKNIQGNLSKRSFDDLESKKIGNYVYALRDPRDGKIFYIGQGTGNRLFDHFKYAETVLKNNGMASSKEIRILDIWKNEEDVDWLLIAHNLTEENINYVEAAVIDAVGASQNGMSLNEIRGPYSSMLTQEDLIPIGAQPVNPIERLQRVFIFPIKNALAEGRIPYEATRRAWTITENNRQLPAYAVGLLNKISVGSYSVQSWRDVSNNKYEFTGVAYDALLNKNWVSILGRVMNYWKRGNYIIVEFDGEGRYKILRGAGADQKGNWFDL
jgi:hypothetical protein